MTAAEHKSFLTSVLDCSQENDKLVISSYGISSNIFDFNGIAEKIICAADRGAKVYIYYEHCDGAASQLDEFYDLKKSCVKFDTNFNHSKCVIKNDEIMAIGSYNWLSDFDDTSSEGTIVFSGPVCRNLKEDFWEGMRYYQSLQHENIKGMLNFEENEAVYLPREYDLGAGEKLIVLRTPEAHGIFLGDTFKKARKDVIVFSPFIRLHKLKETFTQKRLAKLEHHKVKTVLVTLPMPCTNTSEKDDIFQYIDKMMSKYPSFSYKIQSGFHAKTIVCDDMICEGSFNWLSAVSTLDHEANNYEVSAAVQGVSAQNLLSSFRTSALGQAVIPQDEAASSSQQALFPSDFEKRIRIFSGARYRIEGFCIKLNDDYLRDKNGKTAYFETEEEAKQQAYQFWHASQQDKAAALPQPNKKRMQPDSYTETGPTSKYSRFATSQEKTIPKSFDARVKVFSGASFGKKGFCISLERDYIKNEDGSIMYFPSTDLAKKYAYETWVLRRW